jgi:diguanylate cyclase (GGDEF)-like protein
VAEKIVASVAWPFALRGHDLRVTASIGIATYPHDGPDEETLTKNADIAMYGAKEQGKNGYIGKWVLKQACLQNLVWQQQVSRRLACR